ncbi:hypothetical protein [Helicobacter muridarum]|uniref:Uncharacterized protein n=1 Tax=Helicobacter muridarum TaxID=216 RepID=A0A377PV51_9HELI|nr:hypothetical protein [Helicobacter muridarum]STQ86292.1 Uncharacterised protein [Helicobacter muridarum]
MNNSKTSSFGVGARIGHDSSKFYNSKLYENLQILKNPSNTRIIENQIPKEKLNKIFHHSSECMEELPNNSIHLMLSSPPYN